MDDLEELIRLGKETKSLDYKAPCAWREQDKKACCELVKDVLAFANSGGGFIVIGVSEAPAGFMFEGLSQEMSASFETSRFNRFVQNYADPPVNCTIVKKTLEGNTFVVLEIPAFIETPHICQKTYPDVLQAATLYVRTDNNESAPVKSSADFRALVERSVRNQGDRLLESVRAILTGSRDATAKPETTQRYQEEVISLRQVAELATRYNDSRGNPKYRGFRETWSHPNSYEPDRFSLGELRDLAKLASGEFRGWPFLVVGTGGVEAPKAVDGGLQGGHRWVDSANQDRADYWYLGYSGVLLQRVLMWEESYAQQIQSSPLLNVREIALYVAEGLNSVCTLYEPTLAPGDPITVHFRVTGTLGRSLTTGPGGMPLWATYESALPNIDFVATRPLAEWRAGLVEHAIAVCDFIYQLFNWTHPNLGLARSAIENLFARRLY